MLLAHEVCAIFSKECVATTFILGGLDFPDEIQFESAPIKTTTTKTFLVRYLFRKLLDSEILFTIIEMSVRAILDFRFMHNRHFPLLLQTDS